MQLILKTNVISHKLRLFGDTFFKLLFRYLNIITCQYYGITLYETKLKFIFSQMTAGAVMLTDGVYWLVIFPFLNITDYEMSFVSVSLLLFLIIYNTLHTIESFLLLLFLIPVNSCGTFS